MKLAELSVSPGPLSIFHNKYWEIERGPGDKASPGKTLVSKPDRSHRSVQFSQDELNAAVGVVWFRDQGKTHQVQKDT